MATFDELIDQVRTEVNGNRNQGTAFEKIVVSYLQNEPTYKHQFDEVWMLKDVPEEYGIPKKDLGVDVVARDRNTGKLTAVQAKFYKDGHRVSKGDIDSFVAQIASKYYSAGMMIATTDNWNNNARTEFNEIEKPTSLITLSDLRDAQVNWKLFDFHKNNLNLTKKAKEPRKYQDKIIKKALDYYKDHDRGKIIMAPGTGKTFTSLQIAEKMMKHSGKDTFKVLYLVPSIQLLSQTLFSWNNDVDNELNMISFSVVSDAKATKTSDDLSAEDMGFPATTNVDRLMDNYNSVQHKEGSKDFIVVFSTYQSIEVISKAQKKGLPDFDLIVADEAHRTTGATELHEPSAFTMVHDNNIVRAKKRLYQTATPKIYGQNSKRKAIEQSIEVSSMDDKDIYGEEIARLTFGQAVDLGALTDYRVSVIAVSDSYVNKNMQNIMKDDNNELQTDDIGKIIGIWNAMVKRDGITGEIQGAPMKRAILFADTIAHSKEIADQFNKVVNEYLGDQAEDSYRVNVRHVDGGMNAIQKKEALDWLAGDIPENEARLLSNVRFLTEGIDVPNLDSVIFFSPKKSQIDIVQAVGRIMRQFEGKDYGYIILPVMIDSRTDPDTVLDNNKKYKEVWQVLNALRSTDERFDAMINQLELNKKKPKTVSTTGVGSKPGDAITEDTHDEDGDPKVEQLELDFAKKWGKVENAFYGRIVQKVGNRRYLEDFSDDVAKIAKRHIQKIKDLIATQDGAKLAFNKFMEGLRYNINDSITEQQGIEMIAQHLITQPIFDALFSDYKFAQNNPVSQVLNNVIGAFQVFGFNKEQKALDPLYESVKLRVQGLDNIQAKQKVIVQLYNNFFSTGFKKTTDQMGIVFTPVQVVDFIINSVDWALNKYFDKSLASKDVHILDPFTGTGTFITRTLYFLQQQMKAGRITYDDILRKYLHELHANEIVLLSYYIAAVNIEAVFDEVNGPDRGYQPFEGIVLTDTFESTENQDTLDDDMFGTNNKRLKKQQKQPITAIISNPPYSMGQRNANDDNQNVSYSSLESRIKQTYVKNSKSPNNKSSYDSYIKAFRWASDRIGDKGVIAFVTNSGYLTKDSLDGVRVTLSQEFNNIYILNLRGAIRGKVGDSARKEGQNIFDILTGVSIILMVKDHTDNHNIFYGDIGEYLSRKQKFEFLIHHKSIKNLNLRKIEPDENGDWINKIDPRYKEFIKIVDETNSPFKSHALGLQTNRDTWISGFSKKKVLSNTQRLIENYNYEVSINGGQNEKSTMRNPKRIKWSRGLDKKFMQGKTLTFNKDHLVLEMYRPFTKKWLMYDKDIVEVPGQYINKFGKENRVIYVTGKGSRREFSVLAIDKVPDWNCCDAGQGFMQFNNQQSNELIPDRDNITDTFAQKMKLSKQDVFYYIYGVLSSKEYQQKYQYGLQKDFPRIPIVKNSKEYVEIGKKLMDLHLNYEDVLVYEDVDIKQTGTDYKVKKMKFAKKRNPETGKLENDRSIIIYNDNFTISNIPEKAYQYIVNGKSAIEWIMDQYQVKTDKKSGITDDPNDYSDDPKYIFNLLLRIINVSVQTVDLINQLPPLEIDE